jgi:glycosyltransferase involved in cell wall biosynthesis
MGAFAWAMRKWPGVQTHLWPYSSQETVQNPWQVDMLDDIPRIPVKSLHEVLTIRQYIDWLCETSDVVVWQALDFPHSFNLFKDMRERHQKPFLMEIDDYVADVPVSNEAHNGYRPGSTRFKIAMEQIKMSDGLVVSTPYLAEQYKEFNEHIYVIPNSIDLKEWTSRPRKRGDRIRIGWIGSGAHSADLEMVASAIMDVTQKYKNAWFYCIHGVPQVFKDMPKVYWTHKWATINLYPRHMASYCFDIGIAPLVDNNFNRGKSNLRWLEYSALKVPTVASPLPDFKRVIESGKNGYLADSIDEWKDRLSELIENEDNRRAMGVSAYNTVKRDFSVPKTARTYLQLLREVAS